MKCLDENDVVALLNGELTPELRLAVDEHVAECSACRALLAAVVPPSPDVETLREPHTATAAGRIAPGATLSRYRIERVLGAGGMAVVYAAHDPELDRKVAIKVLRERDPERADALKTRLVREARAMAQLTHPNVVTVHDVGSFGDRVFVVMELILGTTLRGWIAEKPRTRREILSVFRRAGEGLAAAHAGGLVHRDIKPENLLVASDGRVLVTDFGLARSVAAKPAGELPIETRKLTITGALMGTPAYMAPEQMDGGEATPQSDLFSFCVALYEALHGERPFPGETLTEVRESIRRGQVREPPRGADVPTWLRSVLLGGLSADPAERPASMRALLDELGRDPERRRRQIAGVAAVVLIAGALGSLAYVDHAHRRLCTEGGGRFDAVLTESRIRSLRALDAGSLNAVLAGEIAERRGGLVDRLAHFRRDWIAAYEEACVATRVRGDQSENLLDLRMSCLEQRLAGAGEMAALLERGDREIDRKLASAALPEPLPPCADKNYLLAAVKLPTDPVLRARVIELRDGNARIQALTDAGQYKPALSQARVAMEKSRATNHPTLVAETAMTLASALFYNGLYDEASSAFDEAIVVGESAHDDRTVAIGRIGLLHIAITTGKMKDLYRLERDVEGAVARVGDDPWLHSRLLDIRGRAETAQGHDELAEKLLAERIAFLEQKRNLPPLELGFAENNLGVFLLDKRPNDAIEHFERALAIEAPVLGQHCPDMLLLGYNRAAAVSQARPSRELIATTQALVDDAKIAFSPNDLALARILMLHSKALMAEPETRARASAVMEQALAIYKAQLAPDQDERLQAEAHLAEVLLAAHRYAEAEPHARLSLSEKDMEPLHQSQRGRLRVLASVLLGQHRMKEAKSTIELSISLRTPTMSQQMPRGDAIEDFILGQILEEQGQHARAVPLVKKAEAGFLKATFPEDERLASTRSWLEEHAH